MRVQHLIECGTNKELQLEGKVGVTVSTLHIKKYEPRVTSTVQSWMCVSSQTLVFLKNRDKGKMDLQEKRHFWSLHQQEKKHPPAVCKYWAHLVALLEWRYSPIPLFPEGIWCLSLFQQLFHRNSRSSVLLWISPPFPFWQLHPLGCTAPISSASPSQSKPWVRALHRNLLWWACVGRWGPSLFNVTYWPHTHTLTSPVASESQAALAYRSNTLNVLRLHPLPRTHPVWSPLAFHVERRHFLFLIWGLLLLLPGGPLTFSSLAVGKSKGWLRKTCLAVS